MRSVSIELLMRALLNLGATRKQIAAIIASGGRRRHEA
jgi:chemotaxis receptor (MCP) glutamine deamidase CheD